MLEQLAHLHYSHLYEQGDEASAIHPKPLKNSLALLLAACTGFASSQSAEAAPVLQYGSSGKAVVSLQDQLKQAGCLPPGNPSNGDYNNATYAAVTSFQQQNNLLADGIAGKQTHAALAENRTCTASGEGLKLGSQGEEVRLMQIQLNNWGFPLNGQRLEASGVFDEPTQTALQEFEEYFGQQFQDGILDPQDSKILWASKDKALASKGKELANRLTQGDASSKAENALEMMGSSVVPYLVPLLRSNSEDDRFIAGYALSEIGRDAKAAVSDLIPLLKSSDQNDRSIAISALSQIGVSAKDAEEAIPHLIQLLSDDTPVQFEQNTYPISLLATGVLAEMESSAQSAVPALVDKLENYRSSKDFWKGRETGRALTQIVSSNPAEQLQLLTSGDNKVRRGVAFAIGAKESVDPTVINKLLEIANNQQEDIELRTTAAVSLMLWKQNMEQFYAQNNLTSIDEKWKECPRRYSEAKQEELYFNPATRECRTRSDKGDGLGKIRKTTATIRNDRTRGK